MIVSGLQGGWSSPPHSTPAGAERVDSSRTCAKFHTVHDGRKESELSQSSGIDMTLLTRHSALVLTMDRPLIIGRNPALWYVDSCGTPQLMLIVLQLLRYPR